jgi:hypothetical protein
MDYHFMFCIAALRRASKAEFVLGVFLCMFKMRTTEATVIIVLSPPACVHFSCVFLQPCLESCM